MPQPLSRLAPTVTLACLGLGLTACLSPRVALEDAGSRVVVGEAAPTNGTENLGPIEAVDGEGCGPTGYEGTYDAALVRLKNEAAQRYADYVQITETRVPSFRPGCFDNHYTLVGVAYRRVGGAVSMYRPMAAPAGAPMVAPAPEAAAAPPPTVVTTITTTTPPMPAPASDPVTEPPAPPSDGAVARKLLELKDLRARQLISAEEYERLRRKVLAEAY